MGCIHREAVFEHGNRILNTRHMNSHHTRHSVMHCDKCTHLSCFDIDPKQFRDLCTHQSRPIATGKGGVVDEIVGRKR